MKKLNQIVFGALVALALAACSSGGGGAGNDDPIPGNTVTVTFNTNGGSAVAAQTIDEGALATEPATPTKIGHTFLGWYNDVDYATAFDFADAINDNTTIFANWSVNYYSLTFTGENDNGFSEMYDLLDKAYGMTITLTAAVDSATIPGVVTFKYWIDTTTGIHYAAGSSFTLPARDVTLECYGE